jgi:mono/diheme cytochrome c family protein
MARRVLNVVLGVALLASLGFNWSVRGPRRYRNVEFVPNMMRTVRYNAFEANANFADGATLRPPVPGTIPRGLPPLPPSDANAPFPNPFSAGDRSAMERGNVVFENFCQACHGPRGLGDGLVVQHGFPKPPTLLRARTKELSDDQIFRVLTTGRGKMASYASQLSRDDRWKVILYVRALQQGSGD